MALPTNIILENYKHTISDIILTAANFEEPIIIRKDFIRSLIFIHDYDNNIAPKVQLVCQIEKENYEKVIVNTDTLTATFDIYQVFVGPVVESGLNEDEIIEQEHPWKSFNLKAMNANELSTEEMNQLDPDNNDELVDNKIDSQNTVMLTLYLYDKEAIQNAKKTKYYIVDGGKNDILYRFMQDRNISNVLMTPTDNENTKYIIPYGSMMENLKLLNTLYGLYDTPYIFYMDFGCTYLIEKGKVGNTLKANECPIVTIYLNKQSETGYNQTGSFCDKDSNMYILNAMSFNISDNDTDIDYAVGGTLKTVISSSGVVKTDKIGNASVERTMVVENEKHHSQIMYSIKESKRNMILTFSNIDIDIITPNKKFVMIADETYYNTKYKISGNYRMSNNIILFKRNSENELSASVQIVLNKIPE